MCVVVVVVGVASTSTLSADIAHNNIIYNHHAGCLRALIKLYVELSIGGGGAAAAGSDEGGKSGWLFFRVLFTWRQCC